MRHFKGIILIAALACATQCVFADSLYTFDSVDITYNNDIPATLGYVFSVKNSFEVTSLGWFDDYLNGFQDPHTVSLYDTSSGTLLTSLTLAAGTADPLQGSFRYHNITPVILNPGDTYLLAGTTGSDDPYTENDDVCGFAISPNFIVPENAGLFVDNTPGFNYPDQHYSDYMVYAGPNLEGVPISDAPEPATISLLLLAAGLGLLLFRRFGKDCTSGSAY